MKPLSSAILGLCLFAPSVAPAGAWLQEKGATLVIAKYERGASDRKFDASGQVIANPGRKDENFSLFIDHGVTDRLSFQGQFGTGADRQGLVSNGKGQFEIGARYGTTFPGGALALYSGTAAFEDRDLGWVSDFELTAMAGRSGQIAGVPVFVEGAVSRVLRVDLPHQVRADLTAGLTPRPGVQLFLQAFSGVADEEPGRWIKLQPSVVLTRNAYSLQLGWRSTLLGRAVPVEKGPVLALWRRF